MVRGKIEMKRIENATSRQVTFSKRRSGLLKKAYELSVLCDAEVALIIFSQKGRLYEFASSDIRKTLDRYRKYVKEVRTTEEDDEQQKEQVKYETAILVEKIRQLEMSQRKLLGQDLRSCSREELQEIDSRLEQSLLSVRERKLESLSEHPRAYHQGEASTSLRSLTTQASSVVETQLTLHLSS
ncbi:hypothetical protein V2J09_014530 [Rumex salicifolius]